MEVNSLNNSPALCSSHEYVLAEKKKFGFRDNGKRRGKEECGAKSASDESKTSSFKCLTVQTVPVTYRKK